MGIDEKNITKPFTKSPDQAWKIVLAEYLQLALAIFNPKLHDRINWEKSYTSLNKEFEKNTKFDEVGRKIVDNLFRLHLKNNKTLLLVLHIEVQTEKDTNIGKRMFEYFMNLYRKHARTAEIEQMAIFLDTDLNFRTHFFDFQPHCQTNLHHEYMVVKLWDWEGKITTENLHQGDKNIFKFIILSQLESIKFAHSFQATAKSLRRLAIATEKAGYTKEEIALGWKFIDFITDTQNPKVQEFIHEEEYMARKSGLQEKEILDSWARLHLEDGKAIGKTEVVAAFIQNGIPKEKALKIAGISSKEFHKGLKLLETKKPNQLKKE
jgi:predicted transposase/invertase (TIGR01784 family)